MRIPALLFVFLNLVVPAHASDFRCVLTESERSALTKLMRTDWRLIAVGDQPAYWPNGAPWSMQAFGQGKCTATTTLLNLRSVAANECLCCDVFLFADMEAQQGECDSQLSSITLTRTVGNLSAAQTLAQHFKTIVGVVPEATFRNDGINFTSTAWPSSTVNQVANLTVVKSRDGHVLRLIIYRVLLSPAN